MRNISRSAVDIILFLTGTCLIVFLDRITKIFFLNLLSPGESLPIIPNILHMTLVCNTGMAFGLFKNQGVVFFIIPVVILCLFVFNVYFYRKSDEMLTRPYIVAFSLILGGAIGNLVDRMIYGHVVDFIDFQIWPVFNLADSAITIGAGIIILECFNLSKKKS